MLHAAGRACGLCKLFAPNDFETNLHTAILPARSAFRPSAEESSTATASVLAEDQPRYNAILYLEDLQGQFDDAVSAPGQELRPTSIREVVNAKRQSQPARRRAAGSSNWRPIATWSATSLTVSARRLQEPRVLNTNAFLRHYNDYPYVPFQIVPDLAPRQVAIFAEQLSGQPALELETAAGAGLSQRLRWPPIFWATSSGATIRRREDFLHHARLRGQ